jgi:hypothetical protein
MMVTPVTNARYADFLTAALAAGEVSLMDDTVTGSYPGDPFHAHKHEVEIRAGEWALMPTEDPALRLTFDDITFGVKPGHMEPWISGVRVPLALAGVALTLCGAALLALERRLLRPRPLALPERSAPIR